MFLLISDRTLRRIEMEAKDFRKNYKIATKRAVWKRKTTTNTKVKSILPLPKRADLAKLTAYNPATEVSVVRRKKGGGWCLRRPLPTATRSGT